MKSLRRWPTYYTLAVAIGAAGTLFFGSAALGDIRLFYPDQSSYLLSLAWGMPFVLLMLWGAIMDYKKRKC